MDGANSLPIGASFISPRFIKGTPVQNNPSELMALLCFLMPLFSPKTKSNYDFAEDTTAGEGMLQHFVSLERESDESQQDAYTKLKFLLAPFVLRRRKEDVLSQIMPPKVSQWDIDGVVVLLLVGF
jgi:SNF2 family DNA or RNA helicase